MPDSRLVSFLMLSSGALYRGYSFGKYGSVVAELCFTTGTYGYQHSISDPSFASQILVFTFPHIGNVGANDFDDERNKLFTSGIVVREKPLENDHHLKTKSFDEWLKNHGIVGIYGVDTRHLTRQIVKNGVNNAVIFPESMPKKDAELMLNSSTIMDGRELTLQFLEEDTHLITSKNKKMHPNIRIAVVDFGVKSSILEVLSGYFEIQIIKAKNGFYNEIIKSHVDGVVLSNGPGDPAATAKQYAEYEIKNLLSTDLPILGICLGHQLLAISLGCKTYKLKNPHRGLNHPVYNIDSQSVEISSQNHGFAVSKDCIPDNVQVTHYSLFDETIEGIKVKNKPVFSVQYHPESSPGPNDSKYIFVQFANEVMLRKRNSLC